jgi:hypothetical protein
VGAGGIAAMVASTADWTVAATAACTVAAISVDEGLGAAGAWVQLTAKSRTVAKLRARMFRIFSSFLSPQYLTYFF